MAVDTLINITQDEIEYARMSTLLKSELDYKFGMEGARQEGHAEGRTETSLNITRNLKRMGLSIAQIAEGTGLSPEVIAGL